MSRIPCAYLRIQSAQDHNPRITDGRGCIAMIDSATLGDAPWTRVNDSLMNLPNRTYTPADPPVWIPDVQDVHTVIRYLLYLRELAGPSRLATAEDISRPASRLLSLTTLPSPAFRNVTVSYQLPFSASVSVNVYDANGRLVRPLAMNRRTPAGRYQLTWDCRSQTGATVAPGVYFVRLRAGNAVRTGKVTKC